MIQIGVFLHFCFQLKLYLQLVALPSKIETEFFKLMNGETSLHEFERWVYCDLELEDSLPADDYLDIISFSYAKAGARYELEKLLTTLVDIGRYETYKLRQLIANTKLRTQQLPEYLREFYELYCHGYTFLRRLGLGLGLAMPGRSEKVVDADIKKLIDNITPALEEELDRVSTWLDQNEIILTGEKYEWYYYSYVDHRSAIEQSNDDNFPVFFYRPKHQKPWWQFWK